MPALHNIPPDTLTAAVARFRTRAGVIATLLASALGGLALHLAGVMP